MLLGILYIYRDFVNLSGKIFWWTDIFIIAYISVVRIVLFHFESNRIVEVFFEISNRIVVVETRRAFLSASSSEVMRSSFTTCVVSPMHTGLRSVSCDRDHSLTASTNSGQSYPVDHASPRSQCGRLKAVIKHHDIE